MAEMLTLVAVFVVIIAIEFCNHFIDFLTHT